MGNGIQTVIVRLRNFRDAATVGEYFRQQIPVIINLEDMDNADATRMIDFVSVSLSASAVTSSEFLGAHS